MSTNMYLYIHVSLYLTTESVSINININIYVYIHIVVGEVAFFPELYSVMSNDVVGPAFKPQESLPNSSLLKLT